MSDQIAVAVIGGFFALLVAVVSTFGAVITRRLRVVRDQVQNDHKSNLREELDERHDETRRWFQYLKFRHDTTDARLDLLERIVKRHDGDIDALEDTLGGTRKEYDHAQEPSPHPARTLPLRNRSRGRSADRRGSEP